MGETVVTIAQIIADAERERENRRSARSRRAEASRNERGNTRDRRRRCEWLVTSHWRADVDLLPSDVSSEHGRVVPLGQGQPCCRCYRCGRLLTADTVSPDRIVPGCRGGTYRRENLRPACVGCQRATSRRDLPEVARG